MNGTATRIIYAARSCPLICRREMLTLGVGSTGEVRHRSKGRKCAEPKRNLVCKPSSGKREEAATRRSATVGHRATEM